MPTSPDNDVLVTVENVSKKFCRSLKRSLWYGVYDIATSLNPFGQTDHRQLAIQNSGAAASTIHDPQPTTTLPPLRTDEFWAVQNVSFELRRGECLGLIGHNGAGKSTLLKILNGLIPPDAGRITMKGRVCALIELNAGFNPILSGRENIFNQAALLGFTKEETLAKFDAIVDFAEIGDFLDMPVQNYSSGMRVRLGFAVAAQMEPDVLIIDEVLAVGDVAFRFKCLSAIGELIKSSAVIFVTHSMPQVFHVCSHVLVLDHGQPTFQGGELSEGVSSYLSLLKDSEQNISGVGGVMPLSLCLENSVAGHAGFGEIIRVEYGASLRVSVKLRVDPKLRRIRLQFLLWSAEMLPFLDVMDEDLKGHLFEIRESGEVEVSASISSLRLNAGKYMLSVVVLSEDQLSIYCRHDNAAYVQVVAHTASGAHSLACAEWSVRHPSSLQNSTSSNHLSASKC